ncbi:MAG: aromatic ring-hydroxylating dioxygenase subunit alpha [Rhodospirillaceae bacterium]|nr:aromatic ring-hydroxylating dioxygenase subunit alpha [Rhodospirillaceae bacterium]
MQHHTELRLAAEALDRIGRRALPEAQSAMAVDGTRYTCREALAGEIERLFRGHPLPVAFGCEVAEPGDFLTLDIAGVPVMLIRDDAGTVRGLLNTCRHRGARLLDGAGQVGKAFACPYHNWTYDRCGLLTAQPGAEHFPDVVVGEEYLVRFPTEERDGFVWLLLDPAGTLDLDEALGDFGDELAAFGLADYRHRGSHVWTKRMNWKLGVDTFLEYYHVPILHRASIGKTLFGTVFLYEACGRHSRLVAPRRSIMEQKDENPETWRVVPHATIVYRLFPNAVFVSQGPHVELARFFPDPERPDTTVCRFSFASPTDDERERDWEEMMRLALGVLDTEDFAVMEGVQANLAAGIQREIVFGRNEIGLQNFHQMRDAALAG